ncbi:ABC transporter substrate-binding protein [Chromobacterium sp. IIBBL 290-4]|uniref:substrate-binding periplasmic protein n=1 Tax=Chromobacterium sp. IIBBL 290-4 TaxID=2953890 RepID=UPI0020B89DBF|nr:transporter substrate-binding domain-containing protein [Chromobacterium sp. IIBBL 290-4]UTH73537.1 transporter substrate-binding domain-containing protein [Chromobacterium sp. IIBBL 290-4]
MKRGIGMICLAWMSWVGPARADAQLDEVKLANGEWSPYLSVNLPHWGYASDIVTEAFRLAGARVTYRFYPWARAEAMVRNGDIAGSVVWSTTPERQQFALFSDPVVSDEEVVFHLATRRMKADKVEDFYGLTMATPNGSRLGVWQQAIESGRIHNYMTKDLETGMHQLLIGRIDFFPLIRAVGMAELRQHFPPKQQAAITASPRVFSKIDYRLMISRKYPGAEALLARFNQGLAKLRASGEYRQMEKDFQSGRYDAPNGPP